MSTKNETVTLGEGRAPRRERWPFGSLKPGKYFECDDIARHIALRTAASRAQKKYGKRFSVRKVRLGSGKAVIRVFMHS